MELTAKPVCPEVTILRGSVPICGCCQGPCLVLVLTGLLIKLIVVMCIK